MSRTRVDAVLLVEDKQMECFFRRLLKARHYERTPTGRRKRFYVIPYPPGKGDAKQWIAASLPEEVRKQRRSQAAGREHVLVVSADADTEIADARYRALWGGISPQRNATEKIAVFIPKRSIETWLAYLGGTPDVNEQDQYPRLERPGECRSAVDRFLEIAGDGVPADCPDSLRRAVADEYPRLP